MTKKFEAWFKEYVKQTNQKYVEHLDKLDNDLITATKEAQKITDARMRLDITKKTELDVKVKAAQEMLYNLKYQINNVKNIREDIKETNLKLTAKKVYDKLLKHPKINKIEISKEKNLNIHTEKLEVNNENIGNYVLTYRLPDMFFVRNDEYVVEGKYDHWHVQYGEPCLSSWKPILWQQLDTFQLFLFIDTLIHYLLLSDDTHSYTPFSDWIKKFKAKEKVEAKKLDLKVLSSEQLAYATTYANIAETQLNINDSGWVTTVSTSSGVIQSGTLVYWSTS